jgi:hypothetical protein
MIYRDRSVVSPLPGVHACASTVSGSAPASATAIE